MSQDRTDESSAMDAAMGASMQMAKAKDFVSAWKKLLSYMNRYKALLISSLVIAAIGASLTLIGPNKISEITDLITNGMANGTMDIAAIGALGVLLVFFYVASAILTFGEGYIIASVSQKVARNLRTDISRKINRLPLSYFDRSSHGDVLSRVTNDVDTIGQSMNQSIGVMVIAITLLIGSIVMMTLTNFLMMISAVLSVIVGFVLIIVIMNRSQKYFSQQQDNLGAMNGLVEEVYSNHNIVKIYNGEKDAKLKFDKINKNLFKSSFRSQCLSEMMMPIMSFMDNLGYVVVCLVGAVLIINGSITFGVIVAFTIYVYLFMQPLTEISQAFVGMQSVAAATERVFEFLEEEEIDDECDKKFILRDVKGEVEFVDVHFGYIPGKEIIHGFSARVAPGQKVAIVGPTGAGKTTIANLLMRFYEVNSGEIRIDGVSTKKITRENVHDLFCMVLQDTWIFEGTVMENIIYNKTGVTEKTVEDACKAVGIHHFIKTLPKGYDTIMSDMDILSAGQKQQLTIARAIVQNSPILILDEATSSVDTRTEKQIQEAMDDLMRNRTSFVIAHRLSTIKNADMILVMKDGTILEKDTHDELLVKGGFYSELYASQFQEAEVN